MYKRDITESIGNTPLIKLSNISKKDRSIYSKLESTNPSGSIKDRAALYMIDAAEATGLLKPGGTIIEPTSGNTGISLAMIAAARDYNVIIVIPSGLSKERTQLIRAYGAEIVEIEKGGMAEAVKYAEDMAVKKGYFFPNQFTNESNLIAHYETTSVEILKELGSDFTAFIAGVGTGGTLIGNARRFKEKNKDIKIIAIEPESSPVLTGKEAGSHKIQGIGANFIPYLYSFDLVDSVKQISDEKAYEGAKLLAEKEGILAGFSGGANIMGALELSEELGPDSIVVTVIPDSGQRYLSTDLFEDRDA